MKQDISMFVKVCLNCQQVKAEHLRPGGITQSIEIPTWKWEAIDMDFGDSLRRTRKLHDSIRVIVDTMTKCAHFILVKSTFKAEDYAKLYNNEILRWHGITLSIISYRGAQFTSYFWRYFQKSLVTQVKLSTVFHPQTDGQVKRTIQTLDDMLRAYVIDFKRSSDDLLPLIE